MKNFLLSPFLVGFILVLSITNPTVLFSQDPQIELKPFYDGVSFPTAISHAGDGRLFIAEQIGKIKIIDENGVIKPNLFLDINSIVKSSGGEQGLLGLAFHPQYTVNGFFYVSYTDQNNSTQISRFKVSNGNADIADPNSELKMITIAQNATNNNGGTLVFGPDGYLYIGIGDGGGIDNTSNSAQDLMNPLGKILRIDVDNGNPYAIPSSNPYNQNVSALDEIWARGVRNPWGLSFDKQTGDLWITDVGQSTAGEINIQASTSAGSENYGWRCYEGSQPFNTTGCSGTIGKTFPIYENNATDNACALIGGNVYRGSVHTRLVGHYVFTDYCNRRLYSLFKDGANWQLVNHGELLPSGFTSTIGEGSDGELYLANSSGTVYQITEKHTSVTEVQRPIIKGFFPNPVSGIARVQLGIEFNDQCTVKVLDLTGRECHCPMVFHKDYLEIDTDQLSHDLHILEVVTDNNTVAHYKFMVKN